MTDQKQTIAVIGMGLIGGSISLALKNKCKIIGLDSDPGALDYALENGIIDGIGTFKHLAESDVIFIAAPLSAVRDTIKKVYASVGNQSIITDVASVKGMLGGLEGRIVGGHPMAGTEKSGVRNAKLHLFQNAYYALVKYENTAEEDYRAVTQLVEFMGAKPVHMTADCHDRTVSYVSHMPHAVAYSLINSIISKDTMIAGSGLMDTTRIASSNPEFWTEVFRLNRKNIVNDLDAFIYEINRLRNFIAAEDFDSVKSFLSAAKKTRDKIETNKHIRSSYTLHVDIPDKIGELNKVISKLTENGVNIANIDIVSSREGISGALKLIFNTELEYRKAEKLLNSSDSLD